MFTQVSHLFAFGLEPIRSVGVSMQKVANADVIPCVRQWGRQIRYPTAPWEPRFKLACLLCLSRIPVKGQRGVPSRGSAWLRPFA